MIGFPLLFSYFEGMGLAYDVIGVLSMLASMNGSGSGDPELRRVRREREAGILILFAPFPG